MNDTFLYVSRSLIAPHQVSAAVEGIVDTSVRWNTANEVTGSLIYADGLFAQFIEGPPASISHLEDRLLSDRRHTELKVIQRRRSIGRRFEGWALAYAGQAQYFRNFMLRLHSSTGSERDGERLIEILRYFAFAAEARSRADE